MGSQRSEIDSAPVSSSAGPLLDPQSAESTASIKVGDALVSLFSVCPSSSTDSCL